MDKAITLSQNQRGKRNEKPDTRNQRHLQSIKACNDSKENIAYKIYNSVHKAWQNQRHPNQQRHLPINDPSTKTRRLHGMEY